MDESQIVENQNLPDSELVKLLHRKDTRKFLRPTVFHLFTSKLSPAVTVPSNVLTQSLDETGRLFLDHYISFITEEITICHSQESNFFFSYILRLAAQDAAVLNGIVAWGGMFLLGSQNEEARAYFAKSLALVQTRRQQIAARPTLKDFMALATCFLVLVGAEVSTGDIKFWYHIFLQLRDAFSEYGGLRKFFEDTRHANEGKWIISNYFFHDVNATRTVLSGTHEDINTYKEIFHGHKILETDEYAEGAQGSGDADPRAGAVWRRGCDEDGRPAEPGKGAPLSGVVRRPGVPDSPVQALVQAAGGNQRQPRAADAAPDVVRAAPDHDAAVPAHGGQKDRLPRPRDRGSARARRQAAGYCDRHADAVDSVPHADDRRRGALRRGVARRHHGQVRAARALVRGEERPELLARGAEVLGDRGRAAAARRALLR
ncbi:hypothetical protein KL948_003782 [Ogataea haglerorum]|nr:hypothetical protein KL948_003782 [Ogataea haglerorum]KAG7736922.1 hypothetical protein KL923_004060 [Ogataea haglerorum]